MNDLRASFENLRQYLSRSRAYIGLFCVMFLTAIPIFFHLGHLPIQLWDESRLAINSWEMFKDHDWIVTHYKGQPDMWNTKPPLLIWIQVVFFEILGPTEFALRLPSALAGFCTCLLMFWFLQKKLNSVSIGMLSCLVLTTCLGYIKYHHSPRTGDYDSILSLFITAYALFFYAYLEENKRKYLVYTFIFITLAALTKGVQALIVVPALLIFAILRRKLPSILKEYVFYVGCICFLIIIIGYYLLREKHNPGYLQAVKYNDFSGRYLDAEQANKKQGPKYYYDLLVSKNYHYWYWFIIPSALIGFLLRNVRLNILTAFLSIISCFYFIMISSSATKNDWYDMPLYPFLSIIVAIGIFQVYKWIAAIPYWNAQLTYNIIPLLFLFFIFIKPYKAIIAEILSPEIENFGKSNEDMAFFMKDILHKKRNINTKTYVAWSDYRANIEWYMEIFKDRNYPIDTINFTGMTNGQNVIAYEDKVKKYIEAHYQNQVLETQNDVILYKINGAK